MCVDCSATIIKPDYAAWHLLDSLGCPCPTHMVRQGLLMLTLLGWSLAGEAILRDLPAQRHCILPAIFIPYTEPELPGSAGSPSNHFQHGPLNTQSSCHRNVIFRASPPTRLWENDSQLQTYRVGHYYHKQVIFWATYEGRDNHSKCLIFPDVPDLQPGLSQHLVEQR